MPNRLNARALAVAAAVVLLTATFFLVRGGDDTRTVTAHFPRAVSVYVGTDVRVLHAAYDESAARAAMAVLLGERDRPTAIFISNLNQAIGAVAAVRESKIRVPTDLSLVACDEDPIAAFLDVPLTTIKMPLAELGAAAVDAVLEQIRGAPPHNVTVKNPPALVERAYTGPPPEKR